MAGTDTDTTLQAVVDNQAATIAGLQAQLTALAARMPPEPEAPPSPGTRAPFPRCVYRKSTHKGPDHPGNEVRTVADQAELDACLKAGFQLEPHEFAYDESPAAAATGIPDSVQQLLRDQAEVIAQLRAQLAGGDDAGGKATSGKGKKSGQ